MKKISLLVVTTFVVALSFGQTTIFDISGGGSLPIGWVGTNNIFTEPIEKTDYYLVESGSPSDVITTAIYDVSSYSSVTFSFDVATFGFTSSDNSAKIEISFDGGSTYSQVEASNIPSSSSYISGGSFDLSSTTNQVQIKISNNGTSGRGVRLKDLKLVSNDIIPPTNSLVITGVYDGPLTGGTPKGIELYVINNIPDLSIFGIGVANNGEGTDGEEFSFPNISILKGNYLYLTNNPSAFTSFFGFPPNYSDITISVNGDDTVELFERGLVIDVFGDINADGTGEAWDYEDGWAYRNTAGPNTTFTTSEWDYSGVSNLTGATTNTATTTPFPIGTYTASVLSVVKNEIEGFTLYPNPVVKGNLFLNSSSLASKQILIYDLNGRLVYNNEVENRELINIHHLQKGIYFVRIEEKGKIATRKLVVD